MIDTKYLEVQEVHYKHILKNIHKDLSKAYRAENKTKLRVLDIIGILMIILNFGALLITNAMVASNHKTNITFYEMNPAQAKINDFKTMENKEQASLLFYRMLTHWFMWGFLISVYIIMRMNIKDHKGYYYLMATVIIYAVTISADFINDFGYWIGSF